MTIDVETIVNRYQELFPAEQDSLTRARAFLGSQDSREDTVNRRNFMGHFTASCLLVDASKKRILLFQHPVHNVVLQPGGHFDNDTESPLEVATRKVLQETPYKQNEIQYLPFDYNDLVPIDIDTHDITRNESRNEAAHAHHDLRYVFLTVAGEGEQREFPATNPTDSPQHPYVYRWYDLAELIRWTTFSRLRKKLHNFLSMDSARRRFFIRMTKELPITRSTNTVIVTHILPDSADFLDALRQRTNLIGVIPKPKSIHSPTLKKLKDHGFPVIPMQREEVIKELPKLLNKASSGKTVLLDIGGWFVPALNGLPPESSESVLGIIEDTKNGENKYADHARTSSLPFPVVSVAESELKANEDFLVGKSIVFSADAALRQCGLVLDYLDCGVIGYGKIGRSIAQHLRNRGVKPCVVETNSLRRLQALREECSIRHRDWVNRNVDVIFCATGSKGTNIIDFRSLRSGTFIFSVTSSDDEFDQRMLPEEYELSPHEGSDYVTRCEGKQNHFYLVNDGNAVNFLHGAVLWEFIQLVKGGIYLALKNLVDGTELPTLFHDGQQQDPGLNKMYCLDEEGQKHIAKLWMETVLLGVRLEE